MPWHVPVVAVTAIGVALVYGAITDYKRRIIPNMVPISIMAFGTLTATPWFSKLASLAIMATVLIILSITTKRRSGGGDIKVYCALSFALGLQMVAIILILTIIFSLLTAICAKRIRGRGERIPLCTFVAPSYILATWIPAVAGVLAT